MTNQPKSLGEQNYEQFAHRYAAAVETKSHNAHYERPGTLSLVPDVRGWRVLDAGCGPGIYAEWLIDRGAKVVACDVTPQMIEITKKRVGNLAEIHRADLTQPLGFALDESFDLVLCPLVLDYIEDWQPVFREFYRILRSSGIFVFSCGHPMADFLITQNQQLTPGNYFDVEKFAMEWHGFGEPYPIITSYRRPLQTILNPLAKAGFILDEILEPQPTEQFLVSNPESYEKLMREPGFLCVRARKL